MREAPAECGVGRIGPPRGTPCAVFSMTTGERVMLSTPPAINTSPCPLHMVLAALFSAWSPELHRRLVVSPGTTTGKDERTWQQSPRAHPVRACRSRIAVVDTGAAVLLPWRDQVSAILVTYFGG